MKKKSVIIISIIAILASVAVIAIYTVNANKSNNQFTQYEAVTEDEENKVEYTYINLSEVDNKSVEEIFNHFVKDYTTEADTSIAEMNIKKYSSVDYYIGTTFKNDNYGEFRYADGDYGASVYDPTNTNIYNWPK